MDKPGKKLRVFWIRLDIVLSKPLKVFDGIGKATGEWAHGALMTFGFTSPTAEDAKDGIRAYLNSIPNFKGLTYRIEFEFVGEIEDLDTDIHADEEVAAALLQDPLQKGLWYKTGVGWYED